MKRLIWILIVVAVVAALIQGRSIYMEPRLEAEHSTHEQLEDPQEKATPQKSRVHYNTNGSPLGLSTAPTGD